MPFMTASGEPFVPAVEYTGLVTRPRKTLEEMISLTWSRLADRSIFSKIWTTHNIDFILTPPAAHTAVPHDTWLSVTYTAFFNYLDWPAVVLPTGVVSKDDVKDNGAKYGAEDEEIYRLCKMHLLENTSWPPFADENQIPAPKTMLMHQSPFNLLDSHRRMKSWLTMLHW